MEGATPQPELVRPQTAAEEMFNPGEGMTHCGLALFWLGIVSVAASWLIRLSSSATIELQYLNMTFQAGLSFVMAGAVIYAGGKIVIALGASRKA